MSYIKLEVSNFERLSVTIQRPDLSFGSGQHVTLCIAATAPIASEMPDKQD